MLRVIGHACLGLVIGIVAKLPLPGTDPGGIGVTTGPEPQSRGPRPRRGGAAHRNPVP